MSKHRQIKSCKAFTVIEIIVVIAILGILVMLAMPKIASRVEEAKLAQIKNDVKVAEGVVETYLFDNKQVLNGDPVDFEEMFFSTNVFYDTGGVVESLPTFEDVDYIKDISLFNDITETDYIKNIKSKLKGRFIANNGGKVYYVDEVVSANLPGNDSDFVFFTEPGVTECDDGEYGFSEVEHKANTIVGYVGNSQDIVIPSSISVDGVDYPVEHIGACAFSEENITYPTFDMWSPEGGLELYSITFPETLKTIGNRAFAGSYALIEVTLPRDLISVGRSAFDYTGIQSLTMNNKLEEVGDNAFINLGIDLNIPSSLRIIGEGAFSDNMITEANLENVEELGSWAFRGNQISNLTLPTNMKEIKEGIFLENDITNINFPEGLEIIGRGAFSNNSIEDLVFPSSLKILGEDSFSRNKITNIEFNTLIEKVPKDAFNRNKLRSVILPRNIKLLEQGAFSGRGNEIVDIVIGENVQMSNSSLPENFVSYYIGEGDPEVDRAAGRYISRDGNKWFKDTSHEPYVVSIKKDNTAKIVGYVGNETDLNIPSEFKNKDGDLVPLTSIGTGVFMDLGITSVSIPESVTHIGTEAFMGNKLTRVNFSDNLQVIGKKSFKNNHIVGVELPKNTKVLYQAFMDNEIEAVVFDKTNYLKGGVFANNNMKGVTIPEGFRYINKRLFSGNDITHLIIPGSVETIDDEAFSGNRLVYLNLNNSRVKKIGDYAFSGHALTELRLPGTLEWIAYRSFSNCMHTSSNPCGIGHGNVIEEITIGGNARAYGAQDLGTKLGSVQRFLGRYMDRYNQQYGTYVIYTAHPYNLWVPKTD